MASSSVRTLVDRVAVVTASTKGIGFAIARRLGLDGAKVIVSSRKSKNVEEAVLALQLEGIEASGVVAHVGNKDDRKRLFDYTLGKHGKMDILVSNAAANPHYGDLMTITDSQWDKLMQINVTSAFQLAQEAIPHLETSGHGNLVFVASVAGFQPIQGLGAYSIMKSALIGLSKNLALAVAHRNVRVNAIAPGIIRTDFSKTLIEDPLKHNDIIKRIPLGRIGEAEETAGAVSFLVSDESSYLTGETISVNGGMESRM
ncbi:unnamed protein product, partial [Mesorhabditis belari]|uniref:Short-chain dehydrogenase n=1 Tax=Mesorhabditis belari TaxID=2138241 RepID=A0AAF3FN98_9BILA